MKRGLLALMLPVFLFVFASCGDTYNDTYVVDGFVFSDDFPVPANKWIYTEDRDGLNPYYYCEFSFPEFTRDIYQNGTILVYIYENPSNYSAGYRPVSDSYPYEEYIEVQNNSDEYYNWTVHYSYVCSPGKITFIAVTEDFISTELGEWAPPAQAFRVVLNSY